MFQPDCANQADNGGRVGEDADDIGAVIFWEAGKLRPAGRVSQDRMHLVLDPLLRRTTWLRRATSRRSRSVAASGSQISGRKSEARSDASTPASQTIAPLSEDPIASRCLPSPLDTYRPAHRSAPRPPLLHHPSGHHRHLRELDRLGEDLAVLDREIAQSTVDDPAAKRLLTITGVNLIVAAGGGGDRRCTALSRCREVGQLCRTEPAGPTIRARARPAWPNQQARTVACSRYARRSGPGPRPRRDPLRAFFLRIRARRGHQIAAVAVARKLAVLCWHLLTKDVDYQWARPALVAKVVPLGVV
jgi:hypothetical protein